MNSFFDTTTAVTGSFTGLDVLIGLGFTALLTTMMFITFKKSRPSISYDEKFNVTLAMIALMSTIIMQMVQTNIALSVGIMGSLSIVRFRTNTKDPRDLGFVFWAMGIGLSAATNNYLIGTVGSILMSIFIIMTSSAKNSSNSMLVIIRGSKANVALITATVLHDVPNARIKAENLLENSFEVVYEIRTTHDVQHRLLNKLKTIDGVDTVNMLAPSAELA